MRNLCAVAAILAFGICASATGQNRETSASFKAALKNATKINSLTGDGARPFYIHVAITEAENPQSPFRATIEEWWSSPTQWRREVTARGGLHQTIVVTSGGKSERDEGDYFPLWLRRFVIALFDPIPEASTWTASRTTLEVTSLPNVYSSNTCARMTSKIGTGERATDAFSVICIDGQSNLTSVVSPRYSMTFNDYRAFGKKKIARALGEVPEAGVRIGADVMQLEDLSNANTGGLFTPLTSNDTRFDSIELSAAKLEELTVGNPKVVWPAIRSGNARGNLSMYISIDGQGHVREAWPLNSDNAGLEGPAREQVKQWTIVPVRNLKGETSQVDGGLGFRFETVVSNPFPVLSDAEARELATRTADPEFAPGVVPSGTRYRVRIAVDARGVVMGQAGGDTDVPGTIRATEPVIVPIMEAVRQWQFRPLMKDGIPQQFLADIVFTIR